jgi:RNA polymerase sigma-32 factor
MATMTEATTRLPAVQSGSLRAYLDYVHNIPVLTRDEEQELFARFEEDGDLEAARKIVMSHLRYVVYVARGYGGYGLPLEDLIQQGNVGLMKSVKRFEADRKLRLVSFAVHWIKSEIHEYILKNWKIVKVATTKAQRKLFFNLRKSKSRLGWFSNAEVEMVAEDLGVKPAEVREMEGRLSLRDESLSVSDDDADESVYQPPVLTLGEAEDPAVIVEGEEAVNNQTEGLHAALLGLDERSRDIVASRWLSDQKAGLKELAARYSVSMERIRQIEKRAFERMQPHLV